MSDSGYILLVEDEPAIQAGNRKVLQRRGYRTRQAYTLAEARAILNEEQPCAIVLDIELPDGSGLHFLIELRQTLNVPVLMLTARGTTEDIIRGLEAGGDDYLPKPYEIAEFLARVQTLLRRAGIVPDSLRHGPIKLDIAAGKAYLNGEDMILSQKEYALLKQFLQNPGRLISAETLYEKAWGQPMAGDENALKVAISRLRTKLKDSGYMISSSRGEGYYIEAE